MADALPGLSKERLLLKSGLKKVGISVPNHVQEQLLAYYRLVRERNKALGLTSLTRAEDILQDLFLDSLSLLPYLNRDGHQRLLDIGTGGGFPGLPLKIVRPDLELTLLDSSRKKLGFCQLVALSLGLSGVTVLEGRAEELAHRPGQRESFDLVCFKALAPLRVLVEYGMPFLKTGGRLVAYKGEKAATEITEASSALRHLNARYVEARPAGRGGTARGRCLIFVEKVGTTPDSFPRNTNLIKKTPL